MALDLADRLLTVAVTATLTSAVWIVVGTTVVDRVDAPGASRPAAQPNATASPDRAAAPPPAIVQVGELAIPVAGVQPAQLQDTFGDSRGDDRQHEALDIMAAAGTPVLAAAAGTVESLFVSDDGGNTVYVRSPDRRVIYYYAHLQDYAAGLSEGDVVTRGQQLGTVGSSGNADPTAPHLHFAVLSTDPESEWWGTSTPVNPYPLLVATRN